MKWLIWALSFSLLLLTQISSADYSLVQRVQVEPLQGGVSFNTITLNYPSINDKSWVTAPTIEMRGRKEIVIKNNSSTATISISTVSGSTSTNVGTIAASQLVRFKASSDIHFYISSSTVATVEVWEIR